MYTFPIWKIPRGFRRVHHEWLLVWISRNDFKKQKELPRRSRCRCREDFDVSWKKFTNTMQPEKSFHWLGSQQNFISTYFFVFIPAKIVSLQVLIQRTKATLFVSRKGNKRFFIACFSFYMEDIKKYKNKTSTRSH